MTHHILLIGATLAEAQHLERELLRYGLTLTTAPDGQGSVAAAYHTHPDAIIFGTALPAWNRSSICCSLKADAQTADIPVVMLASPHQTQDFFKGLESGVTDLITTGTFVGHNLVLALHQLGVI